MHLRQYSYINLLKSSLDLFINILALASTVSSFGDVTPSSYSLLNAIKTAMPALSLILLTFLFGNDVLQRILAMVGNFLV